MNSKRLDALRAAATDGVELDGLYVTETDSGYTFEAAGERHTGLDDEGLRACCRAHPEFLNNWYYWHAEIGDFDSAPYAYLRWVERADRWAIADRYTRLRDGLTRTWGELNITATLVEDDTRRYALGHRSDGDRDPADLEIHHDPGDAREIARFDEAGRYRPLKSAPSLRRGWYFPSLSGSELCTTIDFFYPVSIANWALAQSGDLDVTHWVDTIARQSGRYEIVEELPPRAVEWAARACCVDSQCLKRRMWDFDNERQLGATRGSGEIPCREPCSLLIEGAREWSTIEREETQSYQMNLTPSEREQLEAVIAAVATESIDSIPEAAFEDPANRYRIRYLQAKRFARDDEKRGSDATDIDS